MLVLLVVYTCKFIKSYRVFSERDSRVCGNELLSTAGTVHRACSPLPEALSTIGTQLCVFREAVARAAREEWP